ncbi:LysR substrate-binding domain-containing protein [Caulobacter segnis]|uniref:LysR substrate-binding domain-containing protein n=1 Tax=Caulobacter segnis TaxID=88688 RepID=UPI00240EBE9B|nr:LysR substrate-binding domain-containing protein [Caulobacter segnis]MDG2522912.1 LysR substrate-binding domain-containing protein [Caulobacter segnis]
MTLEQLRIFVCVAERLNMTRAAEVLHITQSGVSASISALENAYGTTLFDRVGRRIELSVAGQAFLVEAEKVLNQVRDAQRTLSDLSNLRRGTVSICASQTIGNYWLPPIIAEFNAGFPHLSIDLHISNTAGVARMVQDGDAELGFVEGAYGDSGLTGFDIDGDRLGIFVRPDHPWAHRAPSLDALARGSWVLRESGSGTRSEFVGALKRLGVDMSQLKVRLELPTNEAVRAAVLAGVGAGALSELVVQDAEASGALVRVAIDLPRRAFSMLRHHDRKLSRAAEMFLKGLPQPRFAEFGALRLVAAG